MALNLRTNDQIVSSASVGQGPSPPPVLDRRGIPRFTAAATPQAFVYPTPEKSARSKALEIEIPRFEFSGSLPIVDFIPAIESPNAIANIGIAQNVNGILTLTGNPVDSGKTLQVERVGFKIETTDNTAAAEFIESTFTAMFGLAGDITFRIPAAKFDLTAMFESDLLEISNVLQRRQVAYRIMTIERATGLRFDLPSSFTGEEVETVALVYYAIVYRSFDWPIPSITLFVPATEEMLGEVRRMRQLSSISFGPNPRSRSLFDQQIDLGVGSVRIDDSVIDNFDTIEQELRQNDNHIVNVVIRSVTRRGKYFLPNAPRLPVSPWDAKTQTLINMENLLDSQLAEQFNALALATLAGLDDAEKAELTTRPKLDEDAFHMADPA